MIVQAKIHLYIPCPSCTDGNWKADQLNIGQSTTWSCQCCYHEAHIKRLSENDFQIIPSGRKNTPVTVTLQSVTEPKIILKLNTWKYAHNQTTPKKILRATNDIFMTSIHALRIGLRIL